MLGAERPEPTRRPGCRGDRGLRARGMDLVEPPRDEVLADRLLVGLGEERLDVAVGGRRDPLEDRVRIVVARLDTLEVEDRQAAEPRQRAGHPRVDDGVHRRGEDRDRQVDAAERLGQVDVGRLDRVGAGRERHVLEAVGRPDRVHLRVEDAPLRGARSGSLADGAPVRVDHGAESTEPATPVGRATRLDPLAVERQLEPGGPIRVGQVVADPLDRGPVARPDDLLVGLLEGMPRARRRARARGAARHRDGDGPRRPPRS